MIELYGEQQAHSENLLRSLRENRVAVDKGKTGTGKTYCAAWTVAQLGQPVAVICPVAVIPVWDRVLLLAGVHAQFVINYEKLRNGSTPFGKFDFKRWVWDEVIAKDSVFIFDEAHRVKGRDTLNARIAAACKQYWTILLSATLAKDPTEMRALGYLTGLHAWTNHYKWCLRNGCWKAPFGGLHFKSGTAEAQLLKLNHALFPKFGGGLSRADLGDLFKKNTVTIEAYNLNDGGKIQSAYEATERELASVMADVKNAIELQPLTMTIYVKMRQEVEKLKIPALCAMTEDLVEEGNSVVIGVNFRETLKELCKKLKCPGIYGGQNAVEREQVIQDFQSDKTCVLVVNIQAGGVGISLHDLHGNHPRVSLISPPNSAVDLIQFLGRIDRVGSKTDSIQKLIFAAGSVEEEICARVQLYAGRIELLSDGDLAVDFHGKPLVRKKSSEFISQKENIVPCQVTGTPLSSRRASSPELVAAPQMKTETSNATTSADVPSYNPPSKSPGLRDVDFGSGSSFSISTSCVPVVDPPRQHARLSPSSLKNKAICPGFINDPDSDKKHANRGTLGHKAVEMDDPGLAGEDMVLRAGVIACIKYKKQLITRAGPKSQIYQEVKLPYFDQYGFTDLIVIDTTHPADWSAELADWKFAYNFYVADAPQFWAYCVGIWDKWPIGRITVHVPHPFLGRADVEIFTREKHYSLFSGQIAAIMAKADKCDPADFRISEICAYCGFAGKCVKLAEIGRELADRYSGLEIALPSGTLHGSEVTDPNVFSSLLRAAPVVEKAAEGWRRAAMRLHNGGTEIPGYQLVKTGGRRSVASAKAAFGLLKEHFVPGMTAEAYLDYCTVAPTALDDIVAAAAPTRGKARAKEELAAHLEDADLLTQGVGGGYLKAVKK